MKKLILFLLFLNLIATACPTKPDRFAGKTSPVRQSPSLSPTGIKTPYPTPVLSVQPEYSQTPETSMPPEKPALRKSKCDPNYSGCVPIASDVDCADGKGDGPEYVDGPIRVIGDDIYKLDRDGDGVACE